MDCSPLLCPWNFLGKNARVGCHATLLGFYDVFIPHLPPVLSQIAFLLSHCCCHYIPHILLSLVELPIQTHTHKISFSEIS